VDVVVCVWLGIEMGGVVWKQMGVVGAVGKWMGMCLRRSACVAVFSSATMMFGRTLELGM
jgi:hypothetical protein